MNRRLVLFKTISILMLLALGLGAPGGMHILVAQAGPQTTPPDSLSTSDWAQIQNMLRASIPAQQAYLKASNTDAWDNFGSAVAIDGDTVVVGVYLESSNATGIDGDGTNNLAASAGAAYVFIRSGTTWSQQAYLKASNTDANDWFGMSVAVSGDTIVVGAPLEDSNAIGGQADNTAGDSGAAYVFTRSGTTWSQQAYLKASNTEAGDEFGRAVAVSGDTIVVGAYKESSNATGVNGLQNNNLAGNSGAAYVFTRSGTTWSQQAYLKASNTDIGDWFGRTVGVSGDTVVVEATYEDSIATGVDGNQDDDSAADSGAVYVFSRSGTTWTQQAYIKASNTEAGDEFGSVSISGNTLVVGAYLEDSSATGVGGSQGDNGAANSGAAYVFTRSGTTWTQQAYLKASNTGISDLFGLTVGVSGNTVVIGAAYEDSDATGINGNGDNDLRSESGAAYVFTRDGTTWSQAAFVKAFSPGSMDWFGRSVAVSRDTVVVGATGEDSGAIGVGGDQGDNSLPDSGAAYAFLSPNNPPTDISLSNASVAENQPIGTLVGTLSAIDPDFWNTQTYSLSCSVPGADDSSFQVNGSSLQTNAVFDYETKNAYNICVHTDDGSGATYDKNFAINVTNVIETTRSVFRSIGAQDGRLLESGETTNLGGSLDSTSTTLRLGDDVTRKQYRSILSFATGAALPDTAVITKVTLRVKRESIVGGGNPVTTFQGFMLDLRKGSFGTSALQVSDFQAIGQKTLGPFNIAVSGGWYVFNLTSARPYINKLATSGGLTQIRLRFQLDDNNNALANYLSLYSGNAGATLRPQLIIEYYIP